MNAPNYEVLALRYATHQNRTARANFIVVDAHDVPMPLDYFVWVIRGPIGADSQSAIVVDTGMDATAVVRRPGRVILTPVEEMLRRIDVDPTVVRHVVLTHMHFDHAGSIDLFPAAIFHIQDSEMAFCTGRCMCHRVLRDTFEVDHVISAVRRVHDGRMRFHDGTAEIATHFWANIRTRSPFPIVVDMARMLEGYDIVESLADGPDHIIPGHDPLVLSRFPSVPGMRDVVRLDLPPVR